MTDGREGVVLFAGGGTGGHIYPNLAVLEALKDLGPWTGHFLLSTREVDRSIADAEGLAYTALGVRPWSSKPWAWPAFIQAWRAAMTRMNAIIHEHRPIAVVASGGFVSGPALAAARKHRIPAALVNLDAVPGRANRMMASKATARFSTYPSHALPDARIIGMPLRKASLGPDDKAQARRMLDIDPVSEMLLIVGGSSGARSINQAMTHLLRIREVARALESWQVLHICGPHDEADLTNAYAQAGLHARVQPYCQQMGAAWRGASLAISRAGAGSVAEAWANACPTLFMPYPFHRDQHQKLNARPLVDQDAAVLVTDAIDPSPTARNLAAPLLELMTNPARRATMSTRLTHTRPDNGATLIAQWITTHP